MSPRPRSPPYGPSSRAQAYWRRAPRLPGPAAAGEVSVPVLSASSAGHLVRNWPASFRWARDEGPRAAHGPGLARVLPLVLPYGLVRGQDGDPAVARRHTGPTDTVRALVHSRDGGACLRCAATRELTIHHRVNREMDGAREEWINQAHNLLLVCATCNGWFEDNPRESYESGWKVRRPQLPDAVEVLYPDGVAQHRTQPRCGPAGSGSRSRIPHGWGFSRVTVTGSTITSSPATQPSDRSPARFWTRSMMRPRSSLDKVFLQVMTTRLAGTK